MANPQTWINYNGAPQRFKEIWINDNGTLREFQEMWINDNGTKRLIFRKGLPIDGYTSHYDASQDWELNGNVSRITDLKKQAYHNLAWSTPVTTITTRSNLWTLAGSGTSRHWTIPSSLEPARGGTVRFNESKLTATLIIAIKMGDRALSLNDLFFDCCYFNQSGDYAYTSDYYYYTGKTIASFEFRTRILPVSTTANGRFVHFVGNGANYVDMTSSFLQDDRVTPRFVTIAMKVSNENAKILTKNTVSSSAKESYLFTRAAGAKDLNFKDVRLFDWWGGGVESLAGNFYEGGIWPRNLTDDECIEVMNYMIDKWT